MVEHRSLCLPQSLTWTDAILRPWESAVTLFLSEDSDELERTAAAVTLKTCGNSTLRS
jgi:hypothetical protein